MATSSKVHFNLEALKGRAMESINFRIDQKEQELKSYDDDVVLSERVAEWRDRQHRRLEELIEAIKEGEVGDHQLAKWELEPIPSRDRYERQKIERELRSLENERSRIGAKSGALVADEAGNISLTTTQLAEFFGL